MVMDPRRMLDMAATLEEWGFAEIERREGHEEALCVRAAREGGRRRSVFKVIDGEEYTTLRAAVVELEALKKTVSHIHKTVGGCRLPLTDTCEAQRAVTEVHCTTINAGWPE